MSTSPLQELQERKITFQVLIYLCTALGDLIVFTTAEVVIGKIDLPLSDAQSKANLKTTSDPTLSTGKRIQI